MKKLLLGLGTLSLVVLPVIAVVSCGGVSEYKTDLNITNKNVTQQTIDNAITKINLASQTDDNKIMALQTVFDGVSIDNFKYFEIKATPTSGSTPGTIVLTAKKGFAFGKSSTLSSSLMVNLPISPKTVFQIAINEAMESIEETPTEVVKVAALQSVFDGITAENFHNFDGTFVGNNPNRQIVLTAKPGFTFNGQATITTNPRSDLKITSKFVGQKVINDAVVAYNAAATDATKITALQSVFDGVTLEKLKNFDVQAIPTSGSTPGKIILTAKEGFAFGISSDTLTSMVALTDLNITNKLDSTKAIINKAITDFKAATADPAKITALQTVFTGITTGNFKNFDVQAIPTSESTPGKIVLTAKPGFGFGISSNTLTSIINLPISPKTLLQLAINGAITSMELTPTEAVIIVALQSVFDGITSENFHDFDWTFIGANPSRGILLTAKPGFSFSGQKTITTRAKIDLKIKSIPSIQSTIDKAITDFKAATADAAKITALQTVFTGITTENFKNFDVQAIPASGSTPGKIVLTAKPEYIFGTSETLTSKLS